MASSNKILHTFLALLLLTTSFALLVASIRIPAMNIAGQDLISSTYNHTFHFELCVSALRSDPRSQTSDLQGLAHIALNISIADGQQTLDHIIALKSNAGNNNDTQLFGCLDLCREEYTDAIENLQDAIHALNVSSFHDDLNTLVSTAMTDSDTCEQGFEELKKGSLLTDRNQYSSKLCSIFLCITTPFKLMASSIPVVIRPLKKF